MILGYIITFIVTTFIFYEIGYVSGIYTLLNYYYEENDDFQKLFHQYKEYI